MMWLYVGVGDALVSEICSVVQPIILQSIIPYPWFSFSFWAAVNWKLKSQHVGARLVAAQAELKCQAEQSQGVNSHEYEIKAKQ